MRCWLCSYHSILHGTPHSVLHPKLWFLATSPNFADSLPTRGGVYVVAWSLLHREIPPQSFRTALRAPVEECRHGHAQIRGKPATPICRDHPFQRRAFTNSTHFLVVPRLADFSHLPCRVCGKGMWGFLIPQTHPVNTCQCWAHKGCRGVIQKKNTRRGMDGGGEGIWAAGNARG